jgi:hypothetical protein
MICDTCFLETGSVLVGEHQTPLECMFAWQSYATDLETQNVRLKATLDATDKVLARLQTADTEHRRQINELNNRITLLTKGAERNRSRQPEPYYSGQPYEPRTTTGLPNVFGTLDLPVAPQAEASASGDSPRLRRPRRNRH